MSQQMDLDSDQFMTLLTDALRAGPGSPEWHQAVGTLRASGAAANADEYQMLVRAREDLESGRDYRAVKAGPGFTRKVLEGIDQEASATKRAGLPSANLIAFLAIGVIVGVVVVVAVALLRTPGPENAAVEQLRKLYFTNPVAKADLATAAELPAGWKLAGEVPLKGNKRDGFAPASTQPSNGDKRDYRAGAVVLSESIAPDQARLIDVTFKTTRVTDAVVPQVFVAEAPFDEAKASSAREVYWLLKGGTAQVAIPEAGAGIQVPTTSKETLDPTKTPTVNVKVRFDKDTVVVESGDHRLYEGPHKLSPTAARYVGVRFLRKVNDNSDGVWLSSVSVLKP